MSFFDACVDHFGSFWTLASSFLGAKSSQKLRNARNVRDCGKRGIAGSAELRELLRSPKTLKGALKKLSKSSQRALRKLWEGSQKLPKKLPTRLSKEHFEISTLASSFLGASGRFRRAFLELLDACVQLFGSKKLAKKLRNARNLRNCGNCCALKKLSKGSQKALGSSQKSSQKALERAF